VKKAFFYWWTKETLSFASRSRTLLCYRQFFFFATICNRLQSKQLNKKRRKKRGKKKEEEKKRRKAAKRKEKKRTKKEFYSVAFPITIITSSIACTRIRLTTCVSWGWVYELKEKIVLTAVTASVWEEKRSEQRNSNWYSKEKQS